MRALVADLLDAGHMDAGALSVCAGARRGSPRSWSGRGRPFVSAGAGHAVQVDLPGGPAAP